MKAAEKSPRKRQIFQDCLASFKTVSTNRQEKKQVSVLELQFYRKMNRVAEHNVLVKKLLKSYGSMRKASLATGVPYKTFHRLCQPPVSRKKESKQVWTDIKSFYTSNLVSHELPAVKCKGRRFLNLTLDECYSLYRDGCVREGKKNVSFSTFCRLKPKEVYKVDQTPDRQCICEQCENFRLVKNQLIKLGVKGVPPHITDCIKKSLCKIDSDDRFDDRNDSLHQMNRDYGKIECITRNCSRCGSSSVQLEILQANPDIDSNPNLIQWNRWIWIKKFPSAKNKTLILRTHQGTRKQLLDIFLSDLDSMSQHVFGANWNYAMFQYIRDNLKPGYLLQVLDFGQNYMNVFQDEPQSKHWDHTQTTIHPIVNFFKQEGESVATVEEHIMITGDKSHDKFAVKTFEEMSLNALKKKGFVPTHIVQFNDNCAGQYKGRGTFQFLSYSDVPKLKMYFGARHGKGPADGAVGRVKAAATRAVKSRQVLIRSALEFYSFCKQKLNNNTSGKFVQEFFYVDTINRDEPITAVTTKSSSTWYSVRSCGIPLVLEAREIGCVCESCILGDGTACPNQAYCPPWKAVDLQTGKPLLDENFKNLQWPLPGSCSNRSATSTNITNESSDRSSNRNDRCINSFPNTSTDRPSLFESVLNAHNTFAELETFVDSLPNNFLKPLKCRLHKFNRMQHTIDEVARFSLPCDCPQNYIPIWTLGDGNCLTQSLSCTAFGTDSRHVELRARIVIEGVINKNRYLDNAYLSVGSSCVRSTGSYTEQYALFSGQHAHGDLQDVIESVYEQEMVEMSQTNTYMGMWQIWQATNVLGRPIKSIFPDRGSQAFRADFNRLCVPYNQRLRNKEPFYIMWTPTVQNGKIQHFVPLLKK